MKLAVMQPYLFPYIGYFQLIHASDLFLIYDDVAYITRGYINRNSMLSRNGKVRFTVPVPGASQNKLICDLEFSENIVKVLKTVEHSYAKAPYFEVVFPLIRQILEHDDRSIASICMKSYEAIFSYLGLEKQFERTSKLDYDRSAVAKDRLIALCHKFEADCYINSPGGRELYSRPEFSDSGIELRFIQSLPVEYRQQTAGFVPNLSIIDILMNCSPEKVIQLLDQYELD
ncbi:hypothetical protein MSNKSG1_08753 [Marinobacter santoriniensis NKSG1]|uniref:WbqC-like family protein n=1 Tax=Marinobacter santoriniensis NKSG1 TaxID=1288826 RepID=M7D5G6_9GAMM|nr:WbqC family protein [Marinobacter santoriniensis]EMP55948.1 hypothetical protein MSNKSG1_08753 [Marinobacter santoriniensis NKSG1]